MVGDDGMSFKKIIEEYNLEEEEKRRTAGIYIRLYTYKKQPSTNREPKNTTEEKRRKMETPLLQLLLLLY